MNIVLCRLLHKHGDIATEGSPKPGLCPTLQGFFIVHSTIMQHCTLHAFEQFGALYMHNHDDKYPTRPEFKPGTPRLQAPVDTNEPLGPASNQKKIVDHTRPFVETTKTILSWLFKCLINRIKHRCNEIGTNIITMRTLRYHVTIVRQRCIVR